MPIENDECRDLCKSMKVLTEQRLAFDQNMCKRASAQSVHHKDAVIACMTRDPEGVSEELLQAGVLSAVARVTYMKLRGDQLLHLAEMAHHDELSASECKRVAAEALEAYLAAQRVASECDSNINTSEFAGALPELHPLRLELALRISSVLLHLLGRPVEAWEAAYPVYLSASERSALLGPRGLAITQLLRDHVAYIDVRGGEENDEDMNDPIRDSRGPGEGLDAWSFLRISGHLAEGAVVATPSAKLRALAQVEKARACTTGVARVLLGTMERADVVLSALKQVFSAYINNYAVPIYKCDDGKHVKLQGREVRLQVFLRHGPFLSWSGFEAMCNDFKIAAVTPTALPQAHAVLVPASSSSQQLEPPTPSPTVQEDLRYWTPAEGYLLNAAQARIAFVSACTNRSMVASFPEGTTNMSPAIVGSRSKGETTHAEEKNYWRDMEHVALSGSVPESTGLDFRTFVDAIARCGLIGFSCARAAEESRMGMGTGAVSRARQEQELSAGERTQAILIVQMRLLDNQYVDLTLRSRESEHIDVSHSNRIDNHGLGPHHPTSTGDGKKGGKRAGGDGTKGCQPGRLAVDLEVRRSSFDSKPPTLTPIQAHGGGAGARLVGVGSMPRLGGVRRVVFGTK